MLIVDTNIFVHAVNTDSSHYQAAQALVADWQKRSLPWHTTWPILYEFMRVMTHQRVIKKPLNLGRACTFIEGLRESKGFKILTETEHHTDVIKEIAAQNPTLNGSIMHDVHTVALMREHGIKTIYTADTDFHLFDDLEIINPLR